MVDLAQPLRERLSAAGVDLSALFGPGLGPWEAWLRLRDHHGRRATLIDLYELEAASQGLRSEDLPAEDRRRLNIASLRLRRPGLAAKPVIDIQISVPDAGDESSYLPPLESAGLVLRLRETGHRFLWPPRTRPREVHVHVCGSGSSWERDHLLFRDYLRARPDVCARYASLKWNLIHRWAGDRPAYGAAKTAFVLDALGQAANWAEMTRWRPGRE